MVLTLLRERVRDIKVILIEVQEPHGSIQRKLSLVHLLRHSIHRYLNMELEFY